MTVQAVTDLTEHEARRLTERIRTALDRVSTAWADLAERITEAYQRRADLALGYGSWAEYADAELKPADGIAAEVRRQLVGMLSAQGMSPRAIAPTVGVTRQRVSQIRTEVEQGASGLHPEAERIDRVTGEVVPPPVFPATDVTDWTPEEVDEQLEADEWERQAWIDSTIPAPPKVVGLDGKQYTRPESKPTPRRRPITEAFWERAYDLNKRVESLVALTEDDRFTANREAIADKNLRWMKETANTLARVLAAMEGTTSDSLPT